MPESIVSRSLLLASVVALAACHSKGPERCGEDTCNESRGGGTCDDASGSFVCTCTGGFIGAHCTGCPAGRHPDGAGGCAVDAMPACTPAPGGATGPVQAPVLRSTLPGSWDENWFASPAVVDLDGNGTMEIVAARHSVLYVWNADGTARWRAAWAHSANEAVDHGDTRMWASPVVADLDDDGKLEIAVGADADAGSHSNVAVYEDTGSLRAGFPVRFGDTDEVRSIAAGDLDGDGQFEIVVNKTNAGPATAVYEIDGSMRDGWPQVDAGICDPPAPAEECWDFGGYNQNVGLVDFDDDGYLDVVSSYDAIGFGIFHHDGRPFVPASSFTDRVVTAVEAYHDLALSQQGWGTGDRSEFTYSPPSFGDLDGDGHPELVLAGDHEHSNSTSNQGVTVWAIHADMTRPTGWTSPKDTGLPIVYDGDVGANLVPTRPAPVVANLDDDATPEVLVPTYDGFLHVYESDGVSKWTYEFGTDASPYTGASEPLVVDLDGDGVPEVVFTTFTSGAPRTPETPAHLIVLNANGVELHRIPIFGRGSMAAPTVADVDGDQQPELVISLKDTLGGSSGGVQIWDLPGARTNCLAWPTGRGGYLRQGRPTL